MVYFLRSVNVQRNHLSIEHAHSFTFCAFVITAFAVLIAIVYHAGYILPAHDPIAVPLLAKTIASGSLPLDAFTVGSSAYTYPPGYPILFAPIMRFVPPVDAYFVFKIASLATILLIPVTWAWMQQRLFSVGIPTWQVLLAAYLVFFGIERTIGFSVAFAGKNAVLLGILLAPIIAVIAVEQTRSKLGWLTVIIPFFGLVLVHYTMLHLLACLLGTYAVIGLITKKLSWKNCIRLALMGALVAGLLLFLLNEALLDPRAGSFEFSPVRSLQQIMRTLVARNSPLTIYGDLDFGIPGFPYRGLALIVCTGISVAISYVIKMPSLRYGASLYFGAFIASLAMAFGLVPSGLAMDFARWFMWALQAAIFLQAAIALIRFAQISTGFQRYFSITIIAVGALAALTLIQLDWRLYKYVNESSQVSRTQLLDMQTVLTNASAGRACFIISESKRLPDGLATLQSEKVWEYAESATTCTFMNGSWMQPGQEGGRELNGLPSAKNIISTIDKGTLIFLGTEQRLNAYMEQLATSDIKLEWIRVGGTNALPAWKNVNEP